MFMYVCNLSLQEWLDRLGYFFLFNHSWSEGGFWPGLQILQKYGKLIFTPYLNFLFLIFMAESLSLLLENVGTWYKV